MVFYRGNNTTAGFTIVELLIVIVVIAILAAISIVAYNGIQDRANNVAVESDLDKLTKAMELWKVDHNDAYPTKTQLVNGEANIHVSKGSYYMVNTRNNFYYCVSGDNSQYAFGVVSKSKQGYMLVNGKISKQSEALTYGGNTCSAIGEGDSSAGATGYDGPNDKWSGWVNG